MTTPSAAPAGAVTVYFRKRTSAALVLRHPRLDAGGRTLSVVGPKSRLDGVACGQRLVVRFPGGALVVGRVTHLHQTHDTYRAEIDAGAAARAGATVPPLATARPAAGELSWAAQPPRRT